MTNYCETCKKPIPEGHTTCPSCSEAVLFETEAMKTSDASDVSWSDLVNEAANVGEAESQGEQQKVDPYATFGDEPAFPHDTDRAVETPAAEEEELTAEVLDDAADELVAEVVDEPSEDELIAEIADDSASGKLVGQVVEEPEEEELTAEIADDSASGQLVAHLVDEPEEEELTAEIADESASGRLVGQVVEEPGEEELIADESASGNLVAEVVEEPAAGEVKPDSDVDLGAPAEKGPSAMDLLAAEAGGVQSESVLDDVFAAGQLPVEESTSAVDLGSSAVIEIPAAIVDAVEKEKQAQKSREAAFDDETRIELTSMPEKTADEVLDLGEVSDKGKPDRPIPPRTGKVPPPPKTAPGAKVPGKAPTTKLGKKAIPTQLASGQDLDATIEEPTELGERGVEGVPTKLGAGPQVEATDQLEAAEEPLAADEEEVAAVVDDEQVEEELTAVVDEESAEAEPEVGFVDDEDDKSLRKHGRARLSEDLFAGDVEAPKPSKKATDDEETVAEVDEPSEELAGLAEGEMDKAATRANQEPEQARAVKAVKPVKPRYGRRWLAGISVGLFLGILGYFALWAFAIQPLDKIDALKAVRNATGAGSGEGSSSAVPPPPKPKDDPHALLAEGQFSKAAEAFSKGSTGNTPKDQAAQGEAIWLGYVQKQKNNIKVDAQEVKSATELFNKARGGNDEEAAAQAQFWLAQIDEQTKHPEDARKKYEEGAKKYPKQKRMFEAQLNRLGVGTVEAGALLPEDPDSLVAALALMLVAFQPAGGDSGTEAAPDFFEALMLAQKGDYDKAVQKLQSARKIHDEQRFNRLKKAQNPTSDPLEESFLKACDELMTFIEIRKSLKDNGYLDGGGKIEPKKIDTALKDARTASDTLGAVAKKLKDAKLEDAVVGKAVESLIKEHDTLQGVKGKIKDAKLDDEDVGKSVDALIKEHDTLDGVAKQLKKADLNDKDVPKSVEGLIKEHDTLQTVITKLKDNKIDETDVPKSVDGLIESRKQVEGVVADLDKAGIKEKDPVKGVKEAIAQRDGSNDRLTGVVKKLEAMKMLPKESKPDEIDKGLKMIDDALSKADPGARLREMLATSEKEVRDRKEELVKLEQRRVDELKKAEDQRVKETKDLKDVLAERHPPQEMLDYWFSLLQERSTREDQNKAALQDVVRVRADKQSKTADKGRAFFVDGMAQRNLGNYDEARKRLTDAKDFDGTPPNVVKAAEKSLAELTNPNVYYFPEIDRALFQGKFDRAASLLAQADKVFPDEKGKLAFQRGLMTLEKARADAGDKKLNDDDAPVKAVREAAKAAEDAGSKAEAAYLIGRLEEELGKLPAAREKFQDAVNMLDKDAPSMNLYQLALARVLWKIHRATPAPVGPRLGRNIDDSGNVMVALGGASRLHGVGQDFVALFADDVEKLPPGLTKEGKQADDIAKELEKKLTGADFMLKAQALGIQGRWDEALKVYMKGLQGELRRDQHDALALIIENHPGLRQPPSAEFPNVKLAEQYWGTGLSHFWARRYPEAEKAFFEAVKYDSQDARYRYFLGMALWQQNLPAKRDDAIFNFTEGAKLERTGKPASDAVNAALERIQGQLRQTVNKYRP